MPSEPSAHGRGGSLRAVNSTSKSSRSEGVAPVLARVGTTARKLAGLRTGVVVDPAVLLFGRAALLGLGRKGRTSPGGSCRLLGAVDGWVAVTLARDDDIDAVPAITGIRDS